MGFGSLQSHVEPSPIDIARISVKREPVAFREVLPCNLAGAEAWIHTKFGAADQTNLSELPCNDRRMRSPSTERGEYSCSIRHSRDVGSCRFPSYQNCRVAIVGEAFGCLGIQRDPPGGDTDSGDRCVGQLYVSGS